MMKITNADQVKFRPSSLGDLMSGTIGLTDKQAETLSGLLTKEKRTDKQSELMDELLAKRDSKDLSLTCKRKLIDIFRQVKYGRYSQQSNRYTEKGIKQEEDGIDLYCKVNGIFLKKNKQRIENEWFSGEPDIILPDHTVDIKCSWSLATLPHPLAHKHNEGYEYQGHGYMDLVPSAKKHVIAYCLVNATAALVKRERDSIWYKHGCPSLGEKNFDKYFEAICLNERNMIFDKELFLKDNPDYVFDNEKWEYDIPAEERVVTFEIQRSESAIAEIKERLTECRAWMNKHLFNVG